MKSVGVMAQTEADVQTISSLGLKCVNFEMQPAAIKVGKFTSADDIPAMMSFLKGYSGPVILDFSLPFTAIEDLFIHADLLIMHINEAEILLNRAINSQESIQNAALKLLALGVKSVLLKGDKVHEPLWIHDYWTNGVHSFWLTQRRYSAKQHYPTDAVFSAAITTCLAQDYSLEDALIIAKMYVYQAISKAQTKLFYGGFPEDESGLPYLASMPLYDIPKAFKPSHHLGLYPVVDSAQWVETLLSVGVKTIQLRIKERTKKLEKEIKLSIALAKKYHATLFINDYWDLALEWGAHAVHLGQSDLDAADLDSIRRNGLLLGVSTYCYYEVARAHAICPSYVAIGPIYPTTSKDLSFSSQGIEKLHRWKRTLSYPLVAIGGINIERASDVCAVGVSGIALISAITKASEPKKATRQLLNIINNVSSG